ncbi:MAG TPA: phospholipase D-like domain-containing protein [Vicinamibacterales bacterium]|nr:phospholipase D-like domain-containing protein [Vicinamibacterales bacterium]
MKLVVQPDAGIVPTIAAIRRARKTIDVLIFRLDRLEIARELEAAVVRGVHVRALTAHQNRGGTKSLRKLEMELLAGGVTVSRTADDLVRYHGKMLIIDGELLHVYGFNFTHLDIDKSRSFGVITRNPKIVAEAAKLFEADFERQPYRSRHERLIVSPENARDQLASFIKAARKELLIYDPHVSDDAMLRLLTERQRAGVDVRVIGKVEAKWEIPHEKFPGKRLHVRAILRDGKRAFVGSQSLRKLELEKRREVGIIVADEKVVQEMKKVFEADWALTDSGKKELKKAEKAEKKEQRELAAAS